MRFWLTPPGGWKNEKSRWWLHERAVGHRYDLLPEDVGPVVIAALRQHDAALAAGALVVVDLKKSRVRVLPL